MSLANPGVHPRVGRADSVNLSRRAQLLRARRG